MFHGEIGPEGRIKMGRMRWAAYLWPGLPQLGVRGDGSALALAVGTACLLNLALLSTFVWTELLAADLRTGLWVAVVGSWGVAAGLSALAARRRGPQQERSTGDEFTEALGYYLKGDWLGAQRTLAGLLRRNADDVEARLMLATLLRHTDRLPEAREQLDRLSRTEGAENWKLEIQRERELLAEKEKQDQERPTVAADDDSLPKSKLVA